MTFSLYRSNRVEKLAQALARVVRAPLSNVFARECIVVQGPGMERWLSARLSSELGIWANPWFPFPRAIVELALDAGLGEVPDDQRVYRPETLSLLVARSLEQDLGDPVFEELKGYAARDTGGVAKLGLSTLLATTYDRYLVYRPEQVLAWERGEEQHFQAKLWRRITETLPRTHIARRLDDFQRHMAQGGELHCGPTPLPERISLFGVSTLPPAFLHVLTQLSRHLDVHLFLLTPSPHYWGDFDRKLARGQGVRALLSGLGRVSREFVDLLLEGSSFEEPCPDLFEVDTPRTLLEHLQHDLAELTDRDPQDRGELGPIPVSPADRSLSIHACHSPVRELEVLRDVLRERFELDRTLEPHDVVVLTPDIERYAPAIEAVFTQRDTDARDHIPFRIADRSAARSSSVLEAFVALMDLVGSRLSLSDVLDFVHRVPVRERFVLAETELERVTEWLTEAGARWGIDAAHRTQFGQPMYEQNSFRFALDRLFMGYAARSDEAQSLLGVLPYSDIEGEAAELLGRFARFAETLFDLVRACQAKRSVRAWTDLWLAALPRMLSEEGERGHEHHALRAHMSALATDASHVRYDVEISLEGLRVLLEARFDRGRVNLGFLTSGVTFCEHVPMRAIPFRIVAMVGMDDEAFPRRAHRPSFDLMHERRRPGDHDVRDDDRQLFLEALLSARDAVVITYVGRSAKDDCERPASVLVDQLRRVVDRHFVVSQSNTSLFLSFEHKSCSEQVSTDHALHRFDPRYFTGTPGHFSYDETAASAARALLSPRTSLATFVPSPLAPLELNQVALEDLVAFFRAPQRAFVRARLRVRLPKESEQLPDREPTALDPLARYQLHDRLLTGLLDEDRDEQLRLLTQEGRLPPGTPGPVVFEELERTVRGMLDQLDLGAPLADRPVRVQTGAVLIHGRLRGMHEHARVEFNAALAQDKHRLSTWIRHLAMCASGSPVAQSLLVSRPEGKRRGVFKFRFGPVRDAQSMLSDLVHLYQLGLRMPLPFLRDESSAYVREFRNSGDHEKATLRCQRADSRPNSFVDQAEKYLRQVWSEEELAMPDRLCASDGTQTLDFASVSLRVLGPMFDHLEAEEGT